MGFNKQTWIVALVMLVLLTVKAEVVYYFDGASANCSSPLNIADYSTQSGNDCLVAASEGGTITDASGTVVLSVTVSKFAVFYVNCSASPPILYGELDSSLPTFTTCPTTVFLSNNGPWCWTNVNGPSLANSQPFGCLTQYTNAPTTSGPTVSPTTSRPTTSPTTSRPTASPTSSRPTTSPSTSPTTVTSSPSGVTQSGVCHPQGHIPRKNCAPRIKQCDNIGVKMKWTGRGCRSSTGVILGDGGCQCDGYCGYSCKTACRKDHQCYWANNICMSKATGEPGVPITTCVSST